MALRPHRLLRHVDQLSQTAVREALSLEGAQALGDQRAQAVLPHSSLFLYEILDLRQEPEIDARHLANTLCRPARPKGIRGVQQAVRARRAQLVSQLVRRFFAE